MDKAVTGFVAAYKTHIRWGFVVGGLLAIIVFALAYFGIPPFP